MRVDRRWVLGVGSLVLASPAAAGEPQVCGEGGGPWIRVEMRGVPADLRDVLLTHVRSSLAARRIDLCVSEEASRTAPLATFEVTFANADPAAVIAIDDKVTSKRVERALDLRGVPRDGRGLTIALALDELMRASWAELLLADARPQAPPPEVVNDAIGPPRTAVARPPAPVTDPWEAGAAVAGERYGDGHAQLGADVLGSYAPWSRLGFHARMGLRSARPVQAPRGELRATALTWALGMDVALLPRTSRGGIDVLAEALVTRASFVAEPSEAGAIGSERAALAAYLAIGARARYVLVRPLRAFVQLGGGAPLHTIHATDGNVRVTGLGGVVALGLLGFSAGF